MSRTVWRLLALLAVAYMAVACLHTISDPDAGWHLATGRYHFQHHAIPSTDVLSYTSAGAPWQYPIFAGAALYSVFSAWGYAGLTWFCVAAGVLLVLFLLLPVNSGRSATVAALTVLAVPSLAYRITPRADLFSTLLFAVLLAKLWRMHRGVPVRLWMLPFVMFCWVNLHPGFIAGLGLLAAYVLMELLALPFVEQRAAAWERLRRAAAWIVAACGACLLNPQGIGAFTFALRVVHPTASIPIARVVGEMEGLPFGWHTLLHGFALRDPDASLVWLVAAAAAAVLVALWRRELGAAILLGAAIFAAIHAARFQAMFVLAAVLVGGSLLAESLHWLVKQLQSRRADRLPLLRYAAMTVVALLVVNTALRASDLLSNRQYVVAAATTSFGAGESWWFPERAAAFIEREQLPGQFFQPYNIGGFTALRLGPKYLDYSDGRGISTGIAQEEEVLLAQPPDSPEWKQVAGQRGINVILLSLARYGGLGGFDLAAYCNAQDWQPVYLDEVSLVLLRKTEANRAWLERNRLDCRTAQLAPPHNASAIAQYNFYANAGSVYYTLGRDAEAEAAWQKALSLEQGDPNTHLFLAQLYQAQQKNAPAEAEYRAALQRRESSAAWYALGRLLAAEHRWQAARESIAHAIPLAIRPANQYKALAQVELKLNQPAQALQHLKAAEREGPPQIDTAPSAHEFRAQLSEGRAEAARQQGNLQESVAQQQQSVAETPQSAARWQKLAALAQVAGDARLAAEAAAKAAQLEAAAR
ncbi:MAG: hypothetical protein P4M01_06700 [Acidobacteriota bacterium]|nr:hypothetical protein [Acidobacteriota bacterium]